MQNSPESRAEEVMGRERDAAEARWYRSRWAQPALWLNPSLAELSKIDREQLVEDAKLQARSSGLLIGVIVAWLLLCVAAWFALPASIRHSSGTALLFVPALGVGIARLVAVQMAIRKSLVIRKAFEASQRAASST